MPKQYVKIKESLEKQGKSEKEAKRIAAQTFIKKGEGGTRSSRAKALQHKKYK